MGRLVAFGREGCEVVLHVREVRHLCPRARQVGGHDDDFRRRVVRSLPGRTNHREDDVLLCLAQVELQEGVFVRPDHVRARPCRVVDVLVGSYAITLGSDEIGHRELGVLRRCARNLGSVSNQCLASFPHQLLCLHRRKQTVEETKKEK